MNLKDLVCDDVYNLTVDDFCKAVLNIYWWIIELRRLQVYMILVQASRLRVGAGPSHFLQWSLPAIFIFKYEYIGWLPPITTMFDTFSSEWEQCKLKIH